MRKKTGKKLADIPAPPIDEIGEFERIRAMGLAEKGQIKELYILVSNATRGFIYRKMNYDAIYRTSWEIIEHFRKSGCENRIYESVKEILNESDMVKFAQVFPLTRFI